MNFHPSNDDVISAFTKFLNLYFNCNRLTSSFLLQYLDMVQSFSGHFKKLHIATRKFLLSFSHFKPKRILIITKEFQLRIRHNLFYKQLRKSVNCAESKNSYSPIRISRTLTKNKAANLKSPVAARL